MDYNNETESDNNVQSEKEKILKDAEENELREQVSEELENEETEKVDGTVKDGEATLSLETLSKLLKKFAIGAVALVCLIIFIAVIHNFLDTDLKGIGNTKASYYPLSCTRVYFTWENESYTKARQKKEKDYVPIMDASLVTDLDEEDDEYGERYTYKEYDFNTYIAGIIWTDNYNALDVDNAIVYQAMAIAARSRLIAELPDNCVVLKNYNEQAQSFTELTGSEEKYTEINQAVQLSQGIVIGRNNQIIPARYDIFTYISKRKEQDETYKSSFYYQMAHENEERQQVIPADWVDELEKTKGVEIPKTKEGNLKKLESMSLYGAKYLLEQADSQYELYRILEYYYGRDIEYYTIDTAFSNEYYFSGGCSAISMSSTSLSREEFIKWAENYGNSHGGGAKILADNAGMIYDMATSNGINPELVFTRADVEGYSPGASKNNYWGMGCTNTGGYDACISYSSLADGVAGFLSFVSKSGSLTDLMSRYAYLGDYWYNPGSWGTGGCVYASAIYGSNIPEHVRNACAPGKTCTIAGGGDCVPTTEEDKQAYLVYQSQSMVSARKKIFGLDADICEPTTGIGEPGKGACTIWRQSDSRWGSIKLGSSSTTMSRSGCAVTSLAIAISCSGVTINDAASFNPGTFVNRLNNTGGFTPDALIYWNNNATKYYAPSFQFSTQQKVSGSASDKVKSVMQHVGNNKSILLYFKNEQHPRGHYVVLKSISGTTFTVYDPSPGSVQTYNAEGLQSFVVYNY